MYAKKCKENKWARPLSPLKTVIRTFHVDFTLIVIACPMIMVFVFVAVEKFCANHTNKAIIIATPMKTAISKLIPCKYVESPVLR